MPETLTLKTVQEICKENKKKNGAYEYAADLSLIYCTGCPFFLYNVCMLHYREPDEWPVDILEEAVKDA